MLPELREVVAQSAAWRGMVAALGRREHNAVDPSCLLLVMGRPDVLRDGPPMDDRRTGSCLLWMAREKHGDETLACERDGDGWVVRTKQGRAVSDRRPTHLEALVSALCGAGP